jgi:hypothetical protein
MKNMKVENEAFDEIFYCQPAGTTKDTYHRQFVCGPHKEFVCGTCCMDFALLNELRYDNEYLMLASDQTKRVDRIRRVVDFYYMNPRAEFRRDPSKRRSPQLASLLTQFSGEAEVSVGKVIELAAYLSYVCRSDAGARQRIGTTLDTVLLEDLYAASQNHMIKEKDTLVSSDESSDGIPDPTSHRARKTVPQPHPDPLDQPKPKGSSHKARPSNIDILQANVPAKAVLSIEIQNLVEYYATVFKDARSALRQAGVTSFGSFLEEFRKVIANGDEKVWTLFLQKYAKTGIVGSDVELCDWPASKVRKFLDNNGLVLSPKPSREAMVEMARHVASFASECKKILYHYSIIKNSYRKDNALGSRDENRRRTSPERQTKPQKSVALVVKPAKKSSSLVQNFLVEPQLPLGVRLSSSVKWDSLGRFVKALPFFVRNRISYTKAFPLDSVFHKSLDLLELIADTYDRTNECHPPQDFLIVLTAKDEEGAGEECLAIRCLGGRNIGPSDFPVPILELEYLTAKADPATGAFQTLTKGIRSGSRFINQKCNTRDMGLLVQLFQTNRKQLPSNDVVSKVAGQVSPGWNFSAVRPADPLQRGAFPLCPLCSQSASMVCSLCRDISYCSRKCQVADWRRHYQHCNGCSSKGSYKGSNKGCSDKGCMSKGSIEGCSKKEGITTVVVA